MAGTGDKVQFIELMEKCTKHEALVKAASLTRQHGSSNLPGHEEKEHNISTDNLGRIAVLTKTLSYYRTGLPSSERAVEYLKSRGIERKSQKIAFFI
jgi:hypothetical protein